LVDCPYFTTNIISLDGSRTFDYASLDSFVLYICTDGEADITLNGTTEHLTPFELVMIPAEADSVELSGQATLLEVYIK
jgi:mannose-6-phosphate isomerase